MKEYLIGSISGVFEVLITHPIDYIKTQRQYLANSNLNTHNFYKNIYNKNIFNFYTGITSRLIGIIPLRFIFWGVQRKTHNVLQELNIKTKFNTLLIGTNAGFYQTILDNQIELYKISKMTNNKLSNKDFLKFKGFMPNFYRNIIFSNCISYACFNKKFRSNWDRFFSASIAGAFGSILSQPFDVVKTIKHSNVKQLYTIDNIQNINSLNIIIKLYEKNPKYLFVGGYYRFLLSFFSMGTGFLIYDYLYELLEMVEV